MMVLFFLGSLALLVQDSLTLAAPSIWKPPRENLVSTGLRNLGNTCYLNAQLQCAFHIPRVREIIQTPFVTEENEDTDDETCHENVGLQALRNVFDDMAHASFALPDDDDASVHSYAGDGSVAPVTFCRALGIPVWEQQDSQEFWKLLLPVLELPPLTDLYQGAYQDYISAVDGSGRERRREEPFLDLSLEVISRRSLLDSLQDMFGTPELLSEAEGNGWRPEKGADKVDALKGSIIQSQGLPAILQCHLKRFQYDWQTDVMAKVNDCFTFPKELDLSQICSDTASLEEDDSATAGKTLYDLQAVVVHAGEYGAGHYYAYVRPNVEKNIWYRFNDDDVSRVSFRQVKEDAYGGATRKKKAKKPRSLVSKILGAFSGDSSYGWGGQSSSAYMLQYVRRCDVPFLYDE